MCGYFFCCEEVEEREEGRERGDKRGGKGVVGGWWEKEDAGRRGGRWGMVMKKIKGGARGYRMGRTHLG